MKQIITAVLGIALVECLTVVQSNEELRQKKKVTLILPHGEIP